LATEGFVTIKYPEKVLCDRNRLSQENALTIAEYIISMKREVNPRLSYITYTIQFLSELDFLDNGSTVILDLGNADPQVRSYFSEQLSNEIFYNQVL
jgi:hypothetical protein